MVSGNLVPKVLTNITNLDKFGYWKLKDSTLSFENIATDDATLDLIVENWGRVNFGIMDQFNQQKGIWQGVVFLNDEQIFNWEIFPYEFKRN